VKGSVRVDTVHFDEGYSPRQLGGQELAVDRDVQVSEHLV
jgi:hypothetical protein